MMIGLGRPSDVTIIFFRSDCNNIIIMKDSFENKGIEEDGEDFMREQSPRVTDDGGGNTSDFIIYEDPNKEDDCDDQDDSATIVAKSMQVHSKVKTGQSSADNSKFQLQIPIPIFIYITY